MDEIYLSADIEEQIVQQLRAMARNKKLYWLRRTLKFLVKALPVTLVIIILSALILSAYNQQNPTAQANQSPNGQADVRVSVSSDGLTRVTTTTKTTKEPTPRSNFLDKLLSR